MNSITNNATFVTIVFGVAGLIAVGFGIYWLFNKQAKLRGLALLRMRLDELEPSDPEYNGVRALYTSMMIDAERWGFFHSDSGSAGHSSGDHASGHSGDGAEGGVGHH